MPCQLPTDCFNEIFEHLEDDKVTLHSCLLVNRFWCKISVGILWRDIWDFRYSMVYKHQLKVTSTILSTLIACLPHESKELLRKNEIFISTPTTKPPLFNYVAFCKVLSIDRIVLMIDDVLKNESPNTSLNLISNQLVTEEILK